MTTKEIEIAARIVGANPSFDRRVVSLFKCIPFVNKHYLIASYNLLLRKLLKRTFPATTYFGAKLYCTFGEYVQARIIHFGFYEPNISALVESILTQGAVFLDIGANIGYHSLLASKLVGPKGAVISIEACPSNFAILSFHIRQNHAKNVRIINKAASDVPGSVVIYRGPPGNNGMATTIKSRGYVEGDIVESVPIDNILTSVERSRLRLIKMDIEGGELPVLRRFLQTIGLYPSDVELIVEISTWDDPGGWSEVFAHLRDAGFRAYLIENRYTYDAYSKWEAPAPLRLLNDVPPGVSDVLFSRQQ
jgi:FkbM family methyltransferase